jgi:hypothetical protein
MTLVQIAKDGPTDLSVKCVKLSYILPEDEKRNFLLRLVARPLELEKEKKCLLKSTENKCT